MQKKDLTGKQFGRLTALSEGTPGPGNRTTWNVVCACGTQQFNVKGSRLQSGEKKSCGCLRTNPDVKNTVDLTGKTFGLLTVERPSDVRKNGSVAWDVRCSCGHTKRINGAALRSASGTRSCGCLTRRTGEHHHSSKRPYEAIYNHIGFSRGLEMSLTYEDFADLVKHGEKCHYCSAPLAWTAYTSSGISKRYNLDRKDNSLGYSKDNVVPCCPRCNRAKSSKFTYEEWFGMTKYFRDSRVAQTVRQEGK